MHKLHLSALLLIWKELIVPNLCRLNQLQNKQDSSQTGPVAIENLCTNTTQEASDEIVDTLNLFEIKPC